jgi:hypothetical protein
VAAALVIPFFKNNPMQSRNSGDAALSKPQITCLGGPLSDAGLHIHPMIAGRFSCLINRLPRGHGTSGPETTDWLPSAVSETEAIGFTLGSEFQIRPKVYKISRNPKQRIPKSQRATNQNQNGFSLTVKVQPRLLIFPVLQA